MVAVDFATRRYSAVDKTFRAIKVRRLPTLISGRLNASGHALNKYLQVYKRATAAAQDDIGIAHDERRHDVYHFDPHHHLDFRSTNHESVWRRQSSATEPLKSATASVVPADAVNEAKSREVGCREQQAPLYPYWHAPLTATLRREPGNDEAHLPCLGDSCRHRHW
jgi:hypothetical protein